MSRRHGFGRNCLIARRLLERDVRFVQVWSGMDGATNNWDNHSDIPKELPLIARSVDRPTAALLRDLKQRGMLGRHAGDLDDGVRSHAVHAGGHWPRSQRRHIRHMAGRGGIAAGTSYGQSDEFGYQGVEGRTYCYDLHATILHLLGIDHKRLTFRHNGIDRRLTDVHGKVIHGILA